MVGWQNAFEFIGLRSAWEGVDRESVIGLEVGTNFKLMGVRGGELATQVARGGDECDRDAGW